MKANWMRLGLIVVTALVAVVASVVSRTSSLQADVVAQATPAPCRMSAEVTSCTSEVQGYVVSANDDEPDVLLMALLTTGAAAGAAVLGLIGYVIRNRIGFWLHRPPPREGGPPKEHH